MVEHGVGQRCQSVFGPGIQWHACGFAGWLDKEETCCSGCNHVLCRRDVGGPREHYSCSTAPAQIITQERGGPSEQWQVQASICNGGCLIQSLAMARLYR